MDNRKPKVAACFPKQVELEEGKKYAYCTCGHSENQPFCDGKHKDSDCGFTPLVFVADETKTAYLCQCKHTGNAPYCDGTHKSVEENSAGESDASGNDAETDGSEI